MFPCKIKNVHYAYQLFPTKNFWLLPGTFKEINKPWIKYLKLNRSIKQHRTKLTSANRAPSKNNVVFRPVLTERKGAEFSSFQSVFNSLSIRIFVFRLHIIAIRHISKGNSTINFLTGLISSLLTENDTKPPRADRSKSQDPHLTNNSFPF